MSSWFKRVATNLALIPDQVLVYQAKRGSRVAFGKLYLKYLDPIYRYIYFRLNQNLIEAEDITQSVFLKAWEKLPEFQGNKFRAWLYTIAHNVVVDSYRANKPRVGLDETIVDSRERPEDSLTQDEEIRQLREAMKELTDGQKQVITLKYIEGLSHGEIAKIMNKNEPAVRALGSRALKRLRELLKAYE